MFAKKDVRSRTEIAQLGERQTEDLKVTCSIHVFGTFFFPRSLFFSLIVSLSPSSSLTLFPFLFSFAPQCSLLCFPLFLRQRASFFHVLRHHLHVTFHACLLLVLRPPISLSSRSLSPEAVSPRPLEYHHPSILAPSSLLYLNCFSFIKFLLFSWSKSQEVI